MALLPRHALDASPVGGRALVSHDNAPPPKPLSSEAGGEKVNVRRRLHVAEIGQVGTAVKLSLLTFFNLQSTILLSTPSPQRRLRQNRPTAFICVGSGNLNG